MSSPSRSLANRSFISAISATAKNKNKKIRKKLENCSYSKKNSPKID
jgi:hypothetical protein